MGKHLCKNGFTADYTRWIYYGEAEVMRQCIEDCDADVGVGDMLNRYHEAHFDEGCRKEEPDGGLGPIFREVMVRSIGEGLDVDDPASNQHDSNPATATPRLRWLLIKHNLIDLSKKAFSCKRIEEHKQERVNTQSEIAYMYEAMNKMGIKF